VQLFLVSLPCLADRFAFKSFVLSWSRVAWPLYCNVLENRLLSLRAHMLYPSQQALATKQRPPSRNTNGTPSAVDCDAFKSNVFLPIATPECPNSLNVQSLDQRLIHLKKEQASNSHCQRDDVTDGVHFKGTVQVDYIRLAAYAAMQHHTKEQKDLVQVTERQLDRRISKVEHILEQVSQDVAAHTSMLNQVLSTVQDIRTLLVPSQTRQMGDPIDLLQYMDMLQEIQHNLVTLADDMAAQRSEWRVALQTYRTRRAAPTADCRPTKYG